jgi:hypothetical protein
MINKKVGLRSQEALLLAGRTTSREGYDFCCSTGLTS